MKIKRILSQHRRDFRAIYECEHCGHTQEGSGYDDSYFHEEVIPKKNCESCGQMAKKSYYRPLKTKYPDSQLI